MNIDDLATLAPDPDRAARVRMRCHARLARGQRHSRQMAAIGAFTWRVLTPAVVGACGVLYSIALIVTTLRLHGVFR
jgi:hypothetical protein